MKSMIPLSKKQIILYSSSIAVSLVLIFVVLLSARSNPVTGFVISEPGSEKATLYGLFIGIAMLVGVLTAATMIYKKDNRY